MSFLRLVFVGKAKELQTSHSDHPKQPLDVEDDGLQEEQEINPFVIYSELVDAFDKLTDQITTLNQNQKEIYRVEKENNQMLKYLTNKVKSAAGE